ncbi:MAG TPA: hypothetical protein VJ874_02430 [Candidatus Thermoplasmatota archaeon]|nr:hypothetical protein [Candidatus Thermoplasmatota archaeon]
MAWKVEDGLSPWQAKEKVALLADAGLSPEPRQVGQIHELWMTGRADLRDELESVLACHRIVLEEAARQGVRIEPYKPLDLAEIVVALQHGLAVPAGDAVGQAAALWHELVWAQGLPNANHRTALLYLERRFNPPGQPLRMDFAAQPEWAERLFARSKPLVLEKEFAPDQRAAKAAHRAATVLCFAGFRLSPASAQ